MGVPIENMAYSMMALFYMTPEECASNGITDPLKQAFDWMSKYVKENGDESLDILDIYPVKNTNDKAKIGYEVKDKLKDLRNLIHYGGGGVEVIKEFKDEMGGDFIDVLDMVQKNNNGKMPRDKNEWDAAWAIGWGDGSRANENIEYAKLFARYAFEEVFDKTLDWLKAENVKIKKTDKMPDVFIDGNTLQQ